MTIFNIGVMETEGKDLINRIIEYAKYSNYTIRQFAICIGFDYTTLNSYVNGRRSRIDSDLLIKIVSCFDDISPLWLLTGKGEMRKNELNIKKEIDCTEKIAMNAMAEKITRLENENLELRNRLGIEERCVG